MAPQFIIRSSHCVEGCAIQPVDVIARWDLCPHLGCVVKYLARAGRSSLLLEQTHLERMPLKERRLEQKRLKQTRLKQLKKAEWCLVRELARPQPCPSSPMGVQTFTTEAVLEDWGFLPLECFAGPFHLGKTLLHIKASRYPSRREESLTQALKHLRAGMTDYER